MLTKFRLLLVNIELINLQLRLSGDRVCSLCRCVLEIALFDKTPSPTRSSPQFEWVGAILRTRRNLRLHLKTSSMVCPDQKRRLKWFHLFEWLKYSWIRPLPFVVMRHESESTKIPAYVTTTHPEESGGFYAILFAAPLPRTWVNTEHNTKIRSSNMFLITIDNINAEQQTLTFWNLDLPYWGDNF